MKAATSKVQQHHRQVPISPAHRHLSILFWGFWFWGSCSLSETLSGAILIGPGILMMIRRIWLSRNLGSIRPRQREILMIIRKRRVLIMGLLVKEISSSLGNDSLGNDSLAKEIRN